MGIVVPLVALALVRISRLGVFGKNLGRTAIGGLEGVTTHQNTLSPESD
jgi:hypothetical protein